MSVSEVTFVNLAYVMHCRSASEKENENVKANVFRYTFRETNVASFMNQMMEKYQNNSLLCQPVHLKQSDGNRKMLAVHLRCLKNDCHG